MAQDHFPKRLTQYATIECVFAICLAGPIGSLRLETLTPDLHSEAPRTLQQYDNSRTRCSQRCTPNLLRKLDEQTSNVGGLSSTGQSFRVVRACERARRSCVGAWGMCFSTLEVRTATLATPAAGRGALAFVAIRVGFKQN